MILRILLKFNTDLVSDGEPRSSGRHELLLKPKRGALTLYEELSSVSVISDWPTYGTHAAAFLLEAKTDVSVP